MYKKQYVRVSLFSKIGPKKCPLTPDCTGKPVFMRSLKEHCRSVAYTAIKNNEAIKRSHAHR